MDTKFKIPKEFSGLGDMMKEAMKLKEETEKQIKQVGNLQQKLLPKKTKRIKIDGKDAVISLGQFDSIIIDFTDKTEGEKFYDKW